MGKIRAGECRSNMDVYYRPSATGGFIRRGLAKCDFIQRRRQLRTGGCQGNSRLFAISFVFRLIDGGAAGLIGRTMGNWKLTNNAVARQGHRRVRAPAVRRHGHAAKGLDPKFKHRGPDCSPIRSCRTEGAARQVEAAIAAVGTWTFDPAVTLARAASS